MSPELREHFDIGNALSVILHELMDDVLKLDLKSTVRRVANTVTLRVEK